MSWCYPTNRGFLQDREWKEFSEKSFKDCDESLETNQCACKTHTEGTDNEYESARTIRDYLCRRCKYQWLERRKEDIDELLFYHHVKGETPENVQERLDKTMAKFEEAGILERRIAELKEALGDSIRKRQEFFVTNKN